MHNSTTLSAVGIAVLITGGQPTSVIGCFDVFTLEGRARIHVHAKRKGLDWMYQTLDVQSACLVEFTELLSENNLCGPLVITFFRTDTETSFQCFQAYLALYVKSWTRLKHTFFFFFLALS